MASSQANLEKMHLRQSYRNLWHTDIMGTMRADFPCMQSPLLALFISFFFSLPASLPVRDLVSRRGIRVLMDFPLLLVLQTAASRCGGERSTLPPIPASAVFGCHDPCFS